MIGKAIYSLIIDTENGVGDTIGTRCFPMTAPQGSEYPLVTYEPSPPQPSDTKHGPSTLDVQPAEVVIYSRRFSEAEEIASTLRAMFDRYSGTVATVAIQSVQFQNQSYEHYPEIELYAIVQQYQFRLPRDLSVVVTGSPIEALNLWRLADVDDEIVNAIDRQALVYDESTSQWIADGVGQVVIPVRNYYRDDALTVGQVVKAVGAQGDRIRVALFDPAVDDSKLLVGVISEEIAGGADGHAQVYGELRNITTDTFSVGDILYPQSDGSLDTTENEYPIGIVTRSQQNTGRLFIRLWSPGKGYHQRYRTEAASEMFVGGGATVELYYTATADGDGYVTQDLTAAVGDGNVEERVLRYKAGAFGDSGTTLGYTDAGLAIDATYAEMLTAFNNLLKTESAPITIYATRTEVASRSGLLADYPGAAAAYSLRLLDTDYTGSAIRVRRASDNAEQDIGFDSNGDLDTASLASFCSGTDGFVKVWYDQANSNDATQTTTGDQPKIYDSAAGVVTKNGKAAVQGISDSSYMLLNSAIIGQSDYSIYTAHSYSAVDMLFGGDTPTIGLWHLNSGLRQRFDDGTDLILSGSFVAGDRILSYQNRVSGSCEIAANAGTSTTATVTAAFTINRLFTGFGAGYRYGGKAQEFIMYDSDQSTNRTGIESNINDYYSIYTP